MSSLTCIRTERWKNWKNSTGSWMSLLPDMEYSVSEPIYPEKYLARMKGQLGSEFPDFLGSLVREPALSLHINTQKITDEEMRRLCPSLGEKVPWAAHGYYADSRIRYAKLPFYYAGLYYLQEASAMAPASLLPVEAENRVLDLCAAPGGKSVQLAGRLGTGGLLVSNDLSVSRCQALLKNLEIAGVSRGYVTAENPVHLADIFPACFDRIRQMCPAPAKECCHRDPAICRDLTAPVRPGMSPFSVRFWKRLPACWRPAACLCIHLHFLRRRK